MQLTPSHPGTNIFILTGDIGDQGRGVGSRGGTSGYMSPREGGAGGRGAGGISGDSGGTTVIITRKETKSYTGIVTNIRTRG